MASLKTLDSSMQLGWIWYHQKRLEILIAMTQESSASFKIEVIQDFFQFDLSVDRL